MGTLFPWRVTALILTAAITIVIGCARGVPSLEEPPPAHPAATLTPGQTVVGKPPNTPSPAVIALRADLATTTTSEGPSQEPTSTRDARTPWPDPTSTPTPPTHTTTSRLTAPSVPTMTPSHRQTDARTANSTSTSTATPPIPTLSPTATPLAELKGGSGVSNTVSEPLTFQEFFDEACKLNDRTKWYGDGPRGEWTWREVFDDFTSVVGDYEALVPPDALSEFHEVTLALFRTIVGLAVSQDPDGVALYTHLKVDPITLQLASSTLATIEEQARLEVEVERILMGLDPEILAYFSENSCGQ